MLINKVYAAESEGLGLAEMAGLTGDQEVHYNFLQSFWDYFQADMISSIPISVCSILVIAVLIERMFFYNRNSCDIAFLLNNLQAQLEKSDLDGARNIAAQARSITGEVAEEGIRLLAVQKEDFSKAYDITVNIVTRKLQQYLPILGTVGAIAPFLGLFGTVSGVIKTLWRMSLGGAGGSMELIGEISNALIATGYGLAIAIIAVIFNNIFNNIVKRYEDDFLLLKLLFMSFMEVNFFEGGFNTAAGGTSAAYSDEYDDDDEDIDDSSYPDFLQ